MPALPPPAFWLLAATALYTITGCRSSSSTETPATSEPSYPPFTVMFGQGGGATGRWSGYTINSQGLVTSWNGPVAGTNAVPAGRFEPAKIDSIWAGIRSSGLLADSIHSQGEFTAFVTLETPDIQQRASWIPGVENIDPPQHPLEEFYWGMLREAAMLANRDRDVDENTNEHPK